MSALECSKHIGDSVESAVINRETALEYVGDSVATWYDARTASVMCPRDERPLLGIPIVERDTPVEIKGACVVRSNGDRDSPGHFYIKKGTHGQLLEAAGAYVLAVYAPRDQTPVLRSVVIPASLLDTHLEKHWYTSRASDRPDRVVSQLSWPKVIDREHVSAPSEVSF